MTVYLDHLMVPSRDKMVAAKLLANLLGGFLVGSSSRAIRSSLCERRADD